jgi:hypothetical protein
VTNVLTAKLPPKALCGEMTALRAWPSPQDLPTKPPLVVPTTEPARTPVILSPSPLTVSMAGNIEDRVDFCSIEWADLYVLGCFKLRKLPRWLLLLLKRRDLENRYYRPIPVSREFRALVRSFFPNFDLDPSYWRMFSYLLGGDFFDYQTGKLILSRPVVAEIMGKTGSTDIIAGNFLKEFQWKIIGVGFFGFSYCWVPSRRPRQLDYFLLPPELQEAWDNEDLKTEVGKVWLCDGTAVNKAKERKLRHERKEQALKAAKDSKSKEAGFILNYLNTLPHNLFSKILPNEAAARAVIVATKTGRGRQQAEAYLRGTMREPQPFYRQSGGEGDRLFGIGGCLPMLSSAVRATLAPDWREADIKYSQLAICAWQWKVKEIEAFLAGGGNVWDELRGRMQIPKDLWVEAKNALKEPLYSTTFGMARDNLHAFVESQLQGIGLERDGRLFTSHWMIEALIAARNRMAKEAAKAGGVTNCFGRFIPVMTKSDFPDEDKAEPHQALALVAQAQELQLMLPAFELADRYREDFKIVLFQHDGFSVKFHRREKDWKDRIANVVNGRIAEAGIKTYLDWK